MGGTPITPETSPGSELSALPYSIALAWGAARVGCLDPVLPPKILGKLHFRAFALMLVLLLR